MNKKGRRMINNNFLLFWYYARQEDELFNSFKRFVKYAIKHVYKIEIDGDKGAGADALFFIGRDRKDYVQLFKKIYESCDLRKKYISMYLKDDCLEAVRQTLGSLKFIAEFKNTKQLLHKVYQKDGKVVEIQMIKIPFFERCYLFLKYAKAAYALNELKKANYYNARMAVVLTDIWDEENVFLEHVKQNHIQTISCQHAIPIEEPDQKETAGKLMYLELMSDRYIAWGKKTKDLYDKYNSKPCGVCGNPVIVNDPGVIHDNDIWAVILGIPQYKKINQSLIDIVEAAAAIMDKKVLIRKHPQENVFKTEYRINENISRFAKFTDTASVIFVSISSMIYTYMMKGYIVFKLKSDDKSNDFPEEYLFSSAEELLGLIANNSSYDGKKFAQQYIDCIDTDSMEKYRIYFRHCLKQSGDMR